MTQRIISWPSQDGRHYEAQASDQDQKILIRLYGPHPCSSELDRYQTLYGFEVCWSTQQPVAHEPISVRPN